MQDALDTIVDACRSAVRSVSGSDKEHLMDSIVRRRKVFVYGSGRSGLVGQLFAVRLVQLGLDVHFVGEMTTPVIGSEDLTLLISNTGRTSSVVQTARIARRLGSEVISITGPGDSELSKVSDLTIRLDPGEHGAIGSIAPLGTVFEDSAVLFFDCVVYGIMVREGASEEDMRNRHAIWV